MLIDKKESQIDLGGNKILIKEEKNHKGESTFWKYLDYSNWIPAEIEIEDELKKDYSF
ncbi:MAG: hypothetical protein ACFE96_04215 [Candidatus Hermodarchaeota archaeon]